MTDVTVWQELAATQAVAGAVPFIDPDTYQPVVDDAGMHYDQDNQALEIKKLGMEQQVAGATGNITINKSSGKVRFAAAAQSLLLTNDRIEADSLIFCQIMTDDTTAKSVVATVATAGSATLKLNAASTAETYVAFWVLRSK